MTGWKCPGCGACYAPHVSACVHCQPKAIPAITTTPLYPQPNSTGWPPRPRPENTCGVPLTGAGGRLGDTDYG